MRTLLTLALAALLAAGPSGAAPRRGGGTPVPAPARAAGYLLNTFSTRSNFTTPTVDVGATYASGFQWYPNNFFSAAPSVAVSSIQLNADGSFTDRGLSGNQTISTIGQIAGAPHYVGTAFGGGLYAEAEIRFNPTLVNTNFGWPSWWAMALEHLVGLPGQQWSGQASGYDHFIEADTFEYDRTTTASYGGTAHDWFGIYNSTCPPNYCGVASDYTASTRTVPAGTDWTIYHRIGLRWIPATSLVDGSMTSYFDGEPMGAPITWSQFTTQGPPPTLSTPWTFGVVDTQHLVLILGAGTGAMTVRSVNVWQTSAGGNLTN